MPPRPGLLRSGADHCRLVFPGGNLAAVDSDQRPSALLTAGSEEAANGMATSRLGTAANRPTQKAEEQ